MLGGWLADAKWGRFRTICVGIAICGIAHVIMVIAAIPSVLESHHAYAPFMISVYILAIGAGKQPRSQNLPQNMANLNSSIQT
jgi:dipeptide/tripeptide permease